MRVRIGIEWAASFVWSLGALACGPSHPSLDAGPPESGGDAVAPDVVVAGGVLDEGGLPDTGSCQPGSVLGFHPPGFRSADAGSSVCSAFGGDGGLVESYGHACIGHAATYSTCAVFAGPGSAEAVACYQCLVTPENPDSPGYGPVVAAALPTVNYAACVQALDPTPAGASCALAIYTAAACAEYACKQTCAVVDDTSRRAFVSCIDSAWLGPCVGYGLTAQGCSDAERGDGGSPVARVCFGGNSPEENYLSIARSFCGGG